MRHNQNEIKLQNCNMFFPLPLTGELTTVVFPAVDTEGDGLGIFSSYNIIHLGDRDE